jgi:heme A synthase
VAALVLVVAGSLVNSRQAALSVPDWPLSYGRLLLTRWSGNTAWEQAHRLSAAIVIVLHVVLLVVLSRHAAATGGRRRLARLATLLLSVQVLLGGAVVLALDPPWLGALHVVLAQLFAAAAVLLARACHAGREGGPPAPASRLLAALPGLFCLQIVLGAVSRHPPAGQGVFIGTLVAHALLGLVLVGLSAGAGVGRLRQGETVRGVALLVLAVAQLGVGLALFVVAPEPLAETWPPPAGFALLHASHHVLAALLLGTALQVPEGD